MAESASNRGQEGGLVASTFMPASRPLRVSRPQPHRANACTSARVDQVDQWPEWTQVVASEEWNNGDKQALDAEKASERG